jgi:hypothetical protein
MLKENFMKRATLFILALVLVLPLIFTFGEAPAAASTCQELCQQEAAACQHACQGQGLACRQQCDADYSYCLSTCP